MSGSKIEAVKSRWAAAGALSSARSGACAVSLEDGRVLVTGGRDSVGELNTSEWVTANGSAVAPMMAIPRTDHGCVVLEDGRILVAGGRTKGGETSAAEIFDPSLNEWEAAGNLTSARSGAAVVELDNGQVLFAGGEAAGQALATLDIYDPETGRFTAAPGLMTSARKAHAAAKLDDGRVLIAGGTDGERALETVDIFDPETGQIASAGAMTSARSGLTATTLLGGRVYLAGGSNGAVDLATTEIYDPAQGTFAPAAAMEGARSGHSAVRVPNNNTVLIAGGTRGGEPVAESGVYIPWRNSYEPMAAMSVARSGMAVTALNSKGGVLMAGGAAKGAVTTVMETTALPTVMTDKGDYYPGEFVTITGANWAPAATVKLEVRNVPDGTMRWTKDVVAEANGTISDATLQMQSTDLGKTFSLTATEGGSGRTAQVWTFTDSPKVGSVTVGGQTGALNQGTAGSATYSITVNRGSGSGNFKAKLTIPTTLPAGVSAQFVATPLPVCSSGGQTACLDTATNPRELRFANSDSTLTVTLSITTTTAALATTPPGHFSFIVRAEDSSTPGDFATNTGTLTVGAPAVAPTITSANSTNFTVFSAGTFTVTSTGSPTAALSFTGSLPSGVTFVNNGNGTATLSGTPATGTAGSYPIMITASNGVGANAVQNFTLNVQKAASTTVVACPANVTYTGSALMPCTVLTTGAGGLNQTTTPIVYT